MMLKPDTAFASLCEFGFVIPGKLSFDLGGIAVCLTKGGGCVRCIRRNFGRSVEGILYLRCH